VITFIDAEGAATLVRSHQRRAGINNNDVLASTTTTRWHQQRASVLYQYQSTTQCHLDDALLCLSPTLQHEWHAMPLQFIIAHGSGISSSTTQNMQKRLKRLILELKALVTSGASFADAA
jgi:hypothetical protein